MQVELTGKIIAVLPTQSGHGRNGEWVKNAFVVEYQDGNYASKLCLEVQGAERWDKMKQNVVVGNQVQVKFGVSSREWQGRWFTSTNCFYCANVGVGVQQQNTNNTQFVAPVQPSQSQQPSNADDNALPF